MFGLLEQQEQHRELSCVSTRDSKKYRISVVKQGHLNENVVDCVS